MCPLCFTLCLPRWRRRCATHRSPTESTLLSDWECWFSKTGRSFLRLVPVLFTKTEKWRKCFAHPRFMTNGLVKVLRIWMFHCSSSLCSSDRCPSSLQEETRFRMKILETGTEATPSTWRRSCLLSQTTHYLTFWRETVMSLPLSESFSAFNSSIFTSRTVDKTKALSKIHQELNQQPSCLRLVDIITPPWNLLLFRCFL